MKSKYYFPHTATVFFLLTVAVALFSCLTSLRISDILSLQWHEIVDFAAGGKCVHTITQKNIYNL